MLNKNGILTNENYFSFENSMFYMSTSQIKAFRKCQAGAIAELTGKKKEDIEKKLHAIVLKHLKIEEAKEAKQLEEEPTEEEVEKAFEKRQAKEKKDSEKKPKKGK